MSVVWMHSVIFDHICMQGQVVQNIKTRQYHFVTKGLPLIQVHDRMPTDKIYSQPTPSIAAEMRALASMTGVQI